MLYIIIALLTIIFLAYQYGTWNKNYWRNRNVPCTTPLAFIGDLKSALLIKEHFGVVYCNIYKRFKGCRYVGVYDRRTPTVLIRDPELVKDILQNDFNSFAANNLEYNEKLDRLFSYNPFVKIGEEWKRARSYMSQHMTSVRIKFMVPQIEATAQNMLKYLSSNSGSSPDGIEAKDLTARFTTDVIASAILSLNSNSFLDTPSVFYKITQSIYDGNPGFWGQFQLVLTFVAHGLGSFLGYRFLAEETETAIIKITTDAIEQRKKSKEVRNDFFQTAISMQEKDPETFTDIYIASEVFGFLLDGFESSSAVMTFALFELASNPHIQERARNEVKHVIGKHNGMITYDNIAELPYLDMIISESMRRYSPLIHMQKKSTAKYTLPPAQPHLKPITIEAGTPIVIPLVALQMDPEYFPDPEHFDPERFSENNKDSIKKFTYFPFGEGPRICLGMRLAMTQMKIGLARIIENFEIRVSPKCPKKPLQIDPRILLMRSLGGIWLNFKKID